MNHQQSDCQIKTHFSELNRCSLDLIPISNIRTFVPKWELDGEIYTSDSTYSTWNGLICFALQTKINQMDLQEFQALAHIHKYFYFTMWTSHSECSLNYTLAQTKSKNCFLCTRGVHLRFSIWERNIFSIFSFLDLIKWQDPSVF